MDNYELIEKLINLENQVEDLQRQSDATFILWFVVLIGSCLFFLGNLSILIIINHKYGDL